MINVRFRFFKKYTVHLFSIIIADVFRKQFNHKTINTLCTISNSSSHCSNQGYIDRLAEIYVTDVP